jgi:hypothetical protein
MSTELVSALVGGPGLVALVVAVVAFMQNRRTLSATQPKTEAEKMQIDIDNLRALLAETRAARESDRQDFQYRLAELRAQLAEQRSECEAKVNALLDKFEDFLHENAIGKPHWWPKRHGRRQGSEGEAG